MTSKSQYPTANGSPPFAPAMVAMVVDGSGIAQPINVSNPLAVELVAGADPDPLLATSSVVNITTATAIKATPGRIFKVSVVVAGAAVGTVNDCATTGAVAAANQIGTTPVLLGTTTFDWPCAVGIVIVPGTGQTLAVSYA